MQSTSSDQRIELSKKQDAFIFSEARYPAFFSGLGAGKTFAGCLRALIKAQQGEDGVIIAPTYPMLRDATQRTFFQILDNSNISYEFSKTDGVLHLWNSTIFFRSSDNPERLRGPNLNWAYLDEAAQMRESMWRIAIGRLRIGNRPQAWVTTTPSGYNWLYTYWVEQENTDYQLIHATTRENPFLSDDYILDLEANYTGEFARQEIGGEFVAFEGLVYNEYSYNEHMFNAEIPENWERIRAIDYGYTNPFVCLWGAIDEDGRLWIYDEHYKAQELIGSHAEVIKAKGDIRRTVADHDAQDSAEMRSHGIGSKRARKDVVVGIQKVKARLARAGDGRPRLFIHERCKNTLREFGMYRWPENKEDRAAKEEPVKDNDHAMDALRYMVMELDYPSTPRIHGWAVA